MKIKLLLMTALILISIVSVGENTKGVNYQLTKHTISSGGGLAAGGVYTVTSSIGQVDAGHIASGGNYQFIGGLLAPSGNDLIFRNSFE